MFTSGLSIFSENNKRVFNLLFALLCIVFVSLQWHALYLPYFWDELGVYAPAANQIYHHGLSIMPGAVEPEFSRGHPLFFQFCGALMFTIFGSNVVVAHIFALGVSLLLLLVVYTKTSKYYGHFTGFSAALILAVQPVFVGLSTLLLPEIMVALFAWLALAAYHQGRFGRVAVYSTLAVFSKETAIILPVVLIAYTILQKLLYPKKENRALNPGALALITTPFMFFALFLIAQKIQNGWFFFPYHLSVVTFDWKTVQDSFSRFFNFLLWTQHRYWLKDVILAGLVVAALKGRFHKYVLYNNFTFLTLVFAFAFVCASSMAFYMSRYVMLLLPVIALWAALGLQQLAGNLPLVRWLALGFLCFVALQTLNPNEFHYDEDIAYRRSLNTLQQAMEYLHQNEQPCDTIMAAFPAYYAVTTDNNGYAPVGKSSCDRKDRSGASLYYIECNPGGSWDFDRRGLIPIREFKDGYSVTTVYYRHYLNTTSK